MAALTTMKRHALLSFAGALALIIALNSCGRSEQPEAAKPAAPEPVAEKAAAPAPAPAKPAEPVFAAEPVHLNGFGSDEPAERADEPTAWRDHRRAEGHQANERRSTGSSLTAPTSLPNAGAAMKCA
jgi:hypothetical protein